MINKKVTLKNTLQNIKCDAARYNGKWKFHPGFWVCLSYRIRRLRKYGGSYYRLLLVLDIAIGFIRRIVSDTTIPAVVSIGKGLYLPHPSGVIISHKTRIGSYVVIFQQVTIGEWHDQAPIIGDRTAIFSGAKLFGEMIVGCNCRVGANVVVNADIENYTSVSVDKPVYRKQGSKNKCLKNI